MGGQYNIDDIVQTHCAPKRVPRRQGEAHQAIGIGLGNFWHARDMGIIRCAATLSAVVPRLQLSEHPAQDGFLPVKAVFRFIEYDRLRPLDNILGDFISDMSR